jgi:hypothetical protein
MKKCKFKKKNRKASLCKNGWLSHFVLLILGCANQLNLREVIYTKLIAFAISLLSCLGCQQILKFFCCWFCVVMSAVVLKKGFSLSKNLPFLTFRRQKMREPIGNRRSASGPTRSHELTLQNKEKVIQERECSTLVRIPDQTFRKNA